MSKETDLQGQHNVDDEMVIDTQQDPQQLRRSFLKRFGKYAVTTPAVTFTLMSSYSSKAIASGGSDGGSDGAG